MALQPAFEPAFAPITPIIDTPVGRLAELVHLLADVPFEQALDQVDIGPEPSLDDPLWTVAGALVRLRPRSTVGCSAAGLLAV